MPDLLRTMLFVPANRERMLQRARTAGADALVLDLEDSVPDGDKAAARAAAGRAIPSLAAAGCSVFVRVNGIDTGMTRDDLMAIISGGLAGVVLPKCEQPQDLRDLDVLLREGEMARGVRPGDVRTLPIIESARGVLRCEEIATASDRVLGLSFGGEDYTRDIGVARTADGIAMQYARGVVVTVAAALGLVSIDTPYPDIRDEKGLLAESRLARAMGFQGKYVIHPDQVGPVHRAFTPAAGEVAAAKKLLAAYDRAAAAGEGSISVAGRMVDAPVAERARRVVAAAASSKKGRSR